MKNNPDSETNAAVQTASRELLTATLQRNPLVAVATALIGPVIGLFRSRRMAANELSQLKLETYSLRPVAATVLPALVPTRRVGGSPKDHKGMIKGSRGPRACLQKGGWCHV